MRPPKIPNETYRRICRDVLQTHIAKQQVRRDLLHSKSGRDACAAAIDALLDVMNELCGTKDPPPED